MRQQNPQMPTGKRARQKIERPQEILSAALEEFMRRGYFAARVEDIAANVGVTKGTVYFYFETKEQLFVSVVRRYVPRIEGADLRLEGNQSARGALEEYLSALFDAIAIDERSRTVFHLLISEGRHFPDLIDEFFVEFLSPALDRIRELIQIGVRSGEFGKAAAAISPETLFGPAVIANIWGSVFDDRRPLDVNLLLRDSLRLFSISA